MATTTLRLPPELEADIKQLAQEHERSEHGEMIFALKMYVEREKREVGKDETDTLFSQGKLYPWIVSCNGIRLATVLADSGGHACDYICRTRWISRLQLSATSADSVVIE
jgi:hypothetical protein